MNFFESLCFVSFRFFSFRSVLYHEIGHQRNTEFREMHDHVVTEFVPPLFRETHSWQNFIGNPTQYSDFNYRTTKGGRPANKFPKSQIRKFGDLNVFKDLRTFRKCGNLRICRLAICRPYIFCDIQTQLFFSDLNLLKSKIILLLVFFHGFSSLWQVFQDFPSNSQPQGVGVSTVSCIAAAVACMPAVDCVPAVTGIPAVDGIAVASFPADPGVPMLLWLVPVSLHTVLYNDT